MAYFSFDRTRAHIVGGFTANASAEIQTGVLVKLNTGKKLTLASFTDKPDGFAEYLPIKYAPTLLTADAGEYINVVSGHVLVRCDSTFFYGGTLPTEGATIYNLNSGLMGTSGGVNKIGKCIKTTENYRTPPNSSDEVVMLELTLGGKEVV